MNDSCQTRPPTAGLRCKWPRALVAAAFSRPGSPLGTLDCSFLNRPMGFFQWEIQHVVTFPIGNPSAADTVMKTRSLVEHHG